MFRLIKLALYAVIGYALYEMYQGMTQQQNSRSSGRGSGGGSYGNSFGDSETGAALTGGGSGMLDTASDSSGAAIRHTVGRGVVSRG